MARPTKVSINTKRLLSKVISSIQAIGFDDIPTDALLSTATSLATKTNDKSEESLLAMIMQELDNRDLTESSASVLMSSAVALLAKTGQPDKKTMSKSELAQTESLPSKERIATIDFDKVRPRRV